MRVLAEDAQCTETGPFFPTTTRYVIQNGFSLDQDILQAPDWLVILLLFVALILAFCIIVIALVREHAHVSYCVTLCVSR